MDWHEAYLVQARSEHAVLVVLTRANVEYGHRLHHLQMVTEKLAKAVLTSPGSAQPARTSHAMFVRVLQVVKTRPDLRERLGYADTGAFRAFIDSLLALATRIEQLSPDRAGLTQPNPEYPWRSPAGRDVVVPAQYAFPEFDPNDPKMVKVAQLVRDLLQIVT